MEIFLILTLIFMPILRGAVESWVFAPAQIAALVLILFYVFNVMRYREIDLKRTPVDIPILLFLLVSLISFFNSRYINASITEFIRLVNLALVFYIVVNFIDTREKIKRLLNIILITGTGIALFGLLQYLGVIEKFWWSNKGFLSATYVNHNHFAGLMEMMIPLSIGMILSEKERSKKSLYVYSLLILVLAFLLSMSRGGWFSLTISMIFMAVVIARRGKARYIVLTAALVLVTIGIFAAKAVDINLLLNRISSYKELDFSGRLEIWKGTLGIIKDNWLLGTGLGTFIYNFPKYRPAGLNAFVNYTHSDYLQVISEAGIFAVSLMIFIIVRIIMKGLRTYRIARTPFKSWMSLALTIGVLSMALHGIGDFNFYIPANAVLFTVFSGLIFNINSRREKGLPKFILRLSPVSSRVFRGLTLVVVSAGILFISASLASGIYFSASEKALSKDDPEKAEKMAFYASRISPLNHLYYYQLGEIYRSQARIEMARREYESSLRLNPLDGWSWIGLAAAHYGQKDIRSADFCYKKAVDLDPMNSYYLKKYAGFLLDIGETDLSSKIYKKAAFVMSKSESLSTKPMFFVEGGLYQEAGDRTFCGQDIDEAMKFYRMSEEFTENKEDARVGQVRCYLKKCLVKEAIGKFREVRHTRENKSVLFASLGECYLKRGLVNTAQRFSGKSIACNPENPEGYQLKYKILKRIKGRKEAFKEVPKIVGFNRVPMELDLNQDNFELVCDLKKDLVKEATISMDIVLPAGIYELSVNARGKKAFGIWPRMTIMFNSRDFIDTFVESAEWKSYSGSIVVDYPVNKIEIVYENDYYDEEAQEDRNLYIDGFRLKGVY